MHGALSSAGSITIWFQAVVIKLNDGKGCPLGQYFVPKSGYVGQTAPVLPDSWVSSVKLQERPVPRTPDCL